VSPAGIPRRAARVGSLAACAGLLISPASARALDEGGASRPATAVPVPRDDQPDPEAFEGRTISSITLRSVVRGTTPPAYEPVEAALAQLVRNQLRTEVGAPYDAETMSEDMRRIGRLGRFKRATSEVTILEDGTVAVVLTLEPVALIEDIQIEGNRRVPTRDIQELEEFQRLQGTPVERLQIDRLARRIEGLYRERGFPRATVTWNTEEAEQTGIVLFTVTEAERIRVMDIRFEGNESFTPARLKREIQTSRSTLFNKGILDEQRLEADVASLIEFYQNRGYIDVEVDRLPPQLSPDGREAIVTFLIREGPVYSFRNAQVFYPDRQRETFPTRRDAEAARRPGEAVAALGPGRYAVFHAEPFSSEQIEGLMELKRGDVYSVRKVNASIRAIERAFGKLGYVDVREGTGRFQIQELRDPDAPRQVDLLMTFRPGRPQRTGRIRITGNELTRHEVIREHLDIRPDRPLDSTAIAESEQRLRRSGLFDLQRDPPRVIIQPEDPDRPGYRDVLVEVQETSTGQFNIGGVVSSDSGLTGRLAYSQNNFDITDTPDSLGELLSGKAFRGGGQTLRLEALPGTEVQTFLASLSDPTVFNTDYSASVLGRFRRREFDQFDEQRATGRVTVGRRFGTRWVGNVGARAESIDISDLDPDSPTDIFDVEGSSTITSLSAQLTRSTLDSNILPTRGNRTSIAVEQAGALGGEFTFTTLRFENIVYVPLSRDFLGRTTTFSLQTEVGYIPQGADEAPVFERFFRGGNSFRGFDFRAIAPVGIRQDNGELSDDTVGGTWEFFAGAEIRQPLFQDIVSVVGFVDSGTVTNSIGFADYRVSVGAGVRLRTPLSPAPIALDFGFPLIDEDTDDERLFTFSIDVPF